MYFLILEHFLMFSHVYTVFMFTIKQYCENTSFYGFLANKPRVMLVEHEKNW